MLHEDGKLLAAYRAGETWAYEILYRAFAEPVRRFLAGGFTFVSQGRSCRFRGGSQDIDADAIVQETFARAFAPGTRKHYDGERPFKNYLFSIAKNLVLREVTRRERVLTLGANDEANEALSRKSRAAAVTLFSPEERDPEAECARGELINVTRAYLARLTGEEREFFHHRFVVGLTQEGTAQAMGATRARIKLLEKHQRARFLDELRGAGYFVGYRPRPRWSRAGGLAAAAA